MDSSLASSGITWLRPAVNEVATRDEAAWSGEVAATARAQRCGFTDPGCSGRLQASLLRLPFSGMELGPFGSRAQCRGTARTPPGPGLVTSREVLERPNRYRTCLVHLDRTLHSVQCNILGYSVLASTDRTHKPTSGHCESPVIENQ